MNQENSLPRFNNSVICSVHSALNLSAPVKLPSPPQTTKASISCLTKFKTAFLLPSNSLKAAQRAVPIKVPPTLAKPLTSSHPT